MERGHKYIQELLHQPMDVAGKKKKSHALQNHPLKITGLMVKIRLETEHSNLCYFAV